MFLQQLPKDVFPNQSDLSLPLDASQETLLHLYCRLPDNQRQRRFVDTACVAVKYGVAQRTVQHWISNGIIAAVLIGKKYKVDLQSVERYLQKCAEQREVI